MNSRSLQHEFVQNQVLSMSSWIDDPFSMKGKLAGVANLSPKRSLESYAEELVSVYASFKDDAYTLSIDSLPSDCQNELARLYIESIDREIEWACYGDDESINSEFLCALLAMLKNNTEQTRDNFAQVTTKNILIYYKNTLQSLIDTACNDYFCNEMNQAGYQEEQDMEHGDYHWRKCQ